MQPIAFDLLSTLVNTTSNSVPVAFVEDGVNFGKEQVIFVNIDLNNPVVALLWLDYTCVQNLVQIGSFLVNLTFDSMTLTFAKSDPSVAHQVSDYMCVRNFTKIGQSV
jgi:hypothetical protein